MRLLFNIVNLKLPAMLTFLYTEMDLGTLRQIEFVHFITAVWQYTVSAMSALERMTHNYLRIDVS